MVWAQKCISVLTAGVPFGETTLTFGPAVCMQRCGFDDAEAALKLSSFDVLVIDPTDRDAQAARLAELARALHPRIRVIFSARRSRASAPLLGETLLAGNGRQFVRGLRTMLGA